MSSRTVERPSYLFDVNVLIALGIRHHQFHSRVAGWVQSNRLSHLYTCSVTELGFLRVLSQSVGYAVTLEQAKQQLAGLKTDRRYLFRFLPDDQEAAGLPRWVRTGGQTTDGHLLQLAHAHSAMLATLDLRIPGAFVIP